MILTVRRISLKKKIFFSSVLSYWGYNIETGNYYLGYADDTQGYGVFVNYSVSLYIYHYLNWNEVMLKNVQSSLIGLWYCFLRILKK